MNALIVAGGNSTRIGRSKAFIAYHGVTQISYLYELLRSMPLPVYISCRKNQASQFQEICPLIIDMEPAVGPMGGIFAAMSAYPDSDWLVMACDMPMISEKTIKRLTESYSDKPVITYKSDHKTFPEVLLTIYKKKLFSDFQQAISKKAYSLQKLINKVDKHFISPESEYELINVNTVEDLNMVKSMIKNSQ